MNTRIIPASEDLVQEVAALLSSQDRDYSSYTVVFPGKRPSHFLRRCLAQKEKSGFIPPHIFSMDEFVDSICAAEGKETKKINSFDALAVLYNLNIQARKPIGADYFVTPDAFFPIGLKIFHDFEELYIENVAPARLKEIEHLAGEKLPEKIVNDILSFATLYNRFYARLEELGCATRSMRYRSGAQRFNTTIFPLCTKIIVAGFYRFTQWERALLKKILQTDMALLLFQDGPGVSAQIKKLGERVEMEGEVTKTMPSRPPIHFYKSSDTHGQIFALSALIQNEIQNGEKLGIESVIVLPSSGTLFPLIHNTLPLLPENEFNISMGYPLSRTPVFSFLNSLFQVRASMENGQVYVKDYVKFILHPYTKNIFFKRSAEITRILLHQVASILSTNKTGLFVTLNMIEQMPLLKPIAIEHNEQLIEPTSLSAHLQGIHTNTISKLSTIQNTGHFAHICSEILHYVYKESTAKRHPFFHPFVESFIEALETISKSMLQEMVFSEPSGYFNLLKRYVQTCRTPFEGVPLKGIQVLGTLETRNLSFKNIFILDMNEDSFHPQKDDTFIPLRARELLGLPSGKEAEETIEYHFETLLGGAEKAHIFYMDKNKKERSRLVEKLIWERQKQEHAAGGAFKDDYAQPIQYAIKLDEMTPVQAKKTDAMISFLKGHSYSVTALDTYLKCPLRFYYKYVLGLKEQKTVTPDIEKSEIGNFIHDVLFRYFTKHKGTILHPEDLNEEILERLVDSTFPVFFGHSDIGPAYLLKRRTLAHLKDFLRHYQKPALAEFPTTILELEQKIEVTFAGFNLLGKLDRVEQRGEIRSIIDYKTGSNPEYTKIRFERLDLHDRESWDSAIGSLQLPFYLLLYTNSRRWAIDRLNGFILFLGRSHLSPEIELPFAAETSDVVDQFRKMKLVIKELLLEIIEKNTPFLPPPDTKKKCPECSWRYVCLR